jgi:hypothetical protein
MVKKPPCIRRRHWVRSFVQVRHRRPVAIRGHVKPRDWRHWAERPFFRRLPPGRLRPGGFVSGSFSAGASTRTAPNIPIFHPPMRGGQSG